jgi:hypothetical protein
MFSFSSPENLVLCAPNATNMSYLNSCNASFNTGCLNASIYAPLVTDITSMF